jgi:hypothetical protein
MSETVVPVHARPEALEWADAGIGTLFRTPAAYDARREAICKRYPSILPLWRKVRTTC